MLCFMQKLMVTKITLFDAKCVHGKEGNMTSCMDMTKISNNTTLLYEIFSSVRF